MRFVRGQYADKTLMQVAQLREMASLGISCGAAARRLGMHETRVSQLARAFGIVFSRAPKFSKPWHRQLRDGFAQGLSPKQLAVRVGRSEDTVVVTLCKMGLTAGRRADPARYVRGYDVPDELFERYKELKRLGLTYKEVGYELGLLERPKARAA